MPVRCLPAALAVDTGHEQGRKEISPTSPPFWLENGPGARALSPFWALRISPRLPGGAYGLRIQPGAKLQ